MMPPAPTSCASSTSPPVRRGPRRRSSTWCARTAERCFMPLTVGGGVRTVDDIRKLLEAGADKVSINTAAVVRPRASSREASQKFGAQCIVVAIDAKRVCRRRAAALGDLHPRRAQPTGIDALECARGGRGARRRRDPAHLDGPRRHQRPASTSRFERGPWPTRVHVLVIASGGVGNSTTSSAGVKRRPRHGGASCLDLPLRHLHDPERPRATWLKPASPCAARDGPYQVTSVSGNRNPGLFLTLSLLTHCATAFSTSIDGTGRLK